MNAILSLHHTEEVQEFALRRFPLLIGRSMDADITLNDRWASRRHCEIDFRDERLVVRDLGSKHGTIVNDCAIIESPLLPGDRLTVGLSTFVASYELDGEEIGDVEVIAVAAHQ